MSESTLKLASDRKSEQQVADELRDRLLAALAPATAILDEAAALGLEPQVAWGLDQRRRYLLQPITFIKRL